MPLLQTYEEARLLWDAMGWGITKVAEHLTSLPEMTDFDVSQSTLSRNTSPGRRVPIEPEVALAIEALKPVNGFEGRTDIAVAGIRALHGRAPKVDALELALALLAHFPTDEFALKLADALAKQVDTGGKLDTVQAAVNHADAKLDVLDTKLDKLDRGSGAILQAFRGVMALGGVGVLAAVSTCVAVVAQRPAPVAPVASAPAAAPVEVTVNVGCAIVASVGADGTPRTSNPGMWLGVAAEQMGEKPVTPLDQDVPVKPFPGQKVPPCDAGWAEEPINGGCYVRTVMKPPCGELFRSGNSCYRPVAAAPTKPVGSDTHRPPAP